MSQARINIKGTSDGLVINIDAGPWSDLMSELATQLTGTSSFFKGGRVALRVGPRQLTPGQLQAAADVLEQHQMSLWAVISDSNETRRVATSLGIKTEATSKPAPRPADESRESLPMEETVEDDQGILVQRTLRSGQAIHYDGHVTLIGDVNPGAEIIAGGNVVVWGRVRGTIHAGAGGDDKATVCAIFLSPMQLRIGRYIARSPASESGERSPDVVPEIAFVQDGQIVAESWEREQTK
jgi:septum site-determining protein MinC